MQTRRNVTQTSKQANLQTSKLVSKQNKQTNTSKVRLLIILNRGLSFSFNSLQLSWTIVSKELQKDH